MLVLRVALWEGTEEKDDREGFFSIFSENRRI